MSPFILLSSFLLLVLVVFIVYHSKKVSGLNRKVLELQIDMQQQAQQLAKQHFDMWVQEHSQQLKQQIEESIRSEYEAKEKEWRLSVEKDIRKDAIEKSINTVLGKISEEFAPLILMEKYQVNPKDFRHLGSPVDFIAFRGLSDDGIEPEIIFIEIKSGKSSSLTDREAKVREAVEKSRVKYDIVSLNDLVEKAKKSISDEIEKIV